MRFVKMHGTGNDYVYINLFPGFKDSVPATYDGNGKLLTVEGRPVADVAREVSDRHFGIGSDGLIAIAPSKIADVRMIMFNLDGSEGAMCGNGIRCVAKFAYDKKLVSVPIAGESRNASGSGEETASEDSGTVTSMYIETASGVRKLDLTIEDGVCTYARVDMGQAILVPSEIPVDVSRFEDRGAMDPGTAPLNGGDAAGVPADAIIRRPLTVNGSVYECTCVSMGNPHLVLFMDDIDGLDLEKIGPCFEKHAAFPEQINTEFAEVIDDHTVRMRVWERGSGETMSCGTGSCAVTVAAVLNGYVKRGTEVEVQLRGGNLYDTWDEDGEVWMRGPATTVFTGKTN